jgi:hypothetical protein
VAALKITNIAVLFDSQLPNELKYFKIPKRKLYNEFESIRTGGIKIKKPLSPCGKLLYFQ